MTLTTIRRRINLADHVEFLILWVTVVVMVVECDGGVVVWVDPARYVELRRGRGLRELLNRRIFIDGLIYLVGFYKVKRRKGINWN